MNQPLPNIAPWPTPPIPSLSSSALKLPGGRTLQALATWSQNLTQFLQSVLGNVVTQVNNLEAWGATIASATTITVSASMHHVSGTNSIKTINLTSGLQGTVILVADGAFSLITGGNIALARGPFTIGQCELLVFDPATGGGTWYPQ